MSVEAILDQVRSLSEEERGRLIEKLHEEFSEPEADANDALNELLDERAADADAHPGEGYSIEELAAYLKRPRT